MVEAEYEVTIIIIIIVIIIVITTIPILSEMTSKVGEAEYVSHDPIERLI